MKDTTKLPLTTSVRRRAQHVTRACNTCRRRKSKCDGNQPICASCHASGHECTWSQEEDNRRPSTKAYVETLRNRNQTLEARVATLEARLQSAGLPLDDGQFLSPGHHTLSLNTSFLGSPASSPSPGGLHSSTSTEYGEDDDIDRVGLGLGKLVLEDNDIHHYGPTSAFINLSSATQSPVISPARSSHNDNEIYELRLSAPTTSPEEALADAEWARYLPTGHLLTRQTHDQLIDRFFKFFSSWCYRSIPQAFLRDMHRALSSPADGPVPKSAHYSPMLHNALLSVATAYADDMQIRSKEHRVKFATKAKQYIEDECQKPTLSVVQALAHLSSFHSGLAEQSVGFMYFGMSVRMAQALGLNLDTVDFVRSGHISEEDRRDRIWMFWSTFAQDKCWSVYVGRDFSVPLARTLPYPETVDAHDQAPWIWKRAYPHGASVELLEKEMQRVPLPNKTGHAFVETTKLCVLATQIMDVVYGTNHEISMVKRREKVTEIHLQLDQWHNELPDHLCVQRPKATTNALPHVLMLNLAYNWLTILLHRPFYRTASSSPTPLSPHSPGATDLSVKRCDSAADKIVQLFSAYRRLYGLRFTPETANQIAYTAAMTYLQCAVQFSSKPARRKAALEGVRMCIGFLREIGQTWQCANQTAGILKGLLKEQLSPHEYSPMPSRNATVEVQPPTRVQSRSQSIDQVMEYEAMYTTPPASLQLFTDNFTLDPEMTVVDEFDQDPEFQKLWQNLSQHSSASSPQSAYDTSSPFHAALQMSGLGNQPPIIQEGYLGGSSAGSSSQGAAPTFHHSPLSLSNSPLPHPQQLPSQDPQQLYPNFHHLFRPGVGGVGMSIDGQGLPPPRSLSFDYDQASTPGRTFNAEAFEQTFSSQPSYPLYIPENAASGHGKPQVRRDPRWQT